MDKLQKKAILVTTSTFPTFIEGDATPAFVYELSKRLTEYFDITVLAPYSVGCMKSEEQDGLHIIRFKYWPGKKLLADGAILPNIKQSPWLLMQLPFFFLFQLLAVVKVCRRKNIRLIHSHWVIPQGLTSAIYKMFFSKKIPVLISSHGSDVFGLKGTVFNKVRDFIFSKSNKVTVVGPEIKRQIKNDLKNIPCSVIPMGLDIEKFRNQRTRDDTPQKLLFVGRLAPEKRVLDLVNAFIKLDVEGASLTIVGDGPEKPAIQKLVNQHENINIRLLGAIPHVQIPTQMEQHDVFILPSEREGMPVSLVEAMAAGLICIGADIPQIKDVIQPEQNGFLFEMGNVQDLTQTLKRVCQSQVFSEIRHKAQLCSQEFDWQKIANKFQIEIQEMLQDTLNANELNKIKDMK
jgi:glycosyltransferase involved in cell wall biosynthesis